MAEKTHNRWLTVTRTLGALVLLVVGGVHFQLYQYDYYSRIPTIGPLFLVNFLAATGLGLYLLSPIRPRFGRLGALIDKVAALAGIGVSAGALVALLISEHTPLFGFMEHGYRFSIVLAITSEGVAVVILTLFLVRARASGTTLARRRSGGPINSRPVAPAAER